MNNKKSFSNIINPCWKDIFDLIDKDIYEITEDSYNQLLQNKINIFPTYVNIFNFINYCIPEDIKVVILGQDPYHGTYIDSKTKKIILRQQDYLFLFLSNVKSHHLFKIFI